MENYRVYLLGSTAEWDIEAKNKQDAIDQVLDDPLLREYAKCCDTPYRVVAEEVEGE